MSLTECPVRIITSKTRHVLTLFAGSHDVAISPMSGRPVWQAIPGASDFTYDAWLHAAIAYCRKIGNQVLAGRTRGSTADEMRAFHREEQQRRQQNAPDRDDR